MKERAQNRSQLDLDGVFEGQLNQNIKAKVKEPLLKRPFDFLLSTIGIVISLPLWLLIALLIKLEDRGSVFYVQERWGKDKKKIKVYKFRTMVPDADKKWGRIQARENDPRITGVGKILRATALDELPQLINIWKGEMSFVGPRTLPINEIQVNEKYRNLPDETIPGFDLRLRVRPGLTGIAQIYAPRDVSRKNKFRYDALYIRKQSFWFDIKLILLSFWITFTGKWESRERKVDLELGRRRIIEEAVIQKERLKTNRKLLGELLLEASVIAKEQLEDALSYQKMKGGKLGENLVKKGYITNSQLMYFLNIQLAENILDHVN